MGDMRFIDKVERIRSERGWTQQQLAEAVGVRQATVSDWKAATSKGPNVLVALRIARALGVPLDYLADPDMDELPTSAPAVPPEIVALVRVLGPDEAMRRLAGAPVSVPGIPPGFPVDEIYIKPSEDVLTKEQFIEREKARNRKNHAS